MTLPPLESGWNTLLKSEFEQDYFQDLLTFLQQDQQQHTIYPNQNDIFRAFDLCPLEKTNVVILGQDPYHGEGQAHGLCFSVNKSVKLPPSLKNIYRELNTDLACEIPKHGDLTAWAQQGILLLNSVLTVRAKDAASHAGKGWEKFTDAVIRELVSHQQSVVFLLWGKYAQQKGALINREQHYILEAAHPSPFAARKGFFGCQHFSKTNQWLTQHNKPVINWTIED